MDGFAGPRFSFQTRAAREKLPGDHRSIAARRAKKHGPAKIELRPVSTSARRRMLSRVVWNGEQQPDPADCPRARRAVEKHPFSEIGSQLQPPERKEDTFPSLLLLN